MEKEFDAEKYKREWNKKNMKQIKVSYKNEFVESFKIACKKLNKSQSEVIRDKMLEIIEEAKEK